MTTRVLITGANGLLGSALRRVLSGRGEYDIRCTTHDAVDLTKETEVALLFDDVRPHYVLHAAAKVGGIGANMAFPADFFYDNIMMNTLVLHHAVRVDVAKCIMFSSVCAFPHNLPVLDESTLHNGPVYAANFAYGHAKRMVDVYIDACRQQYETRNYMWVAPSNLYGCNDNYNLENSHVVPGLICKLHRAITTASEFVVWGDGSAKREFIFADDAASCVADLIEKDDLPPGLLLCGDREHSIREVVETLVDVSGFKGNVRWDATRPNGQKCRPTDKSLFGRLFPKFQYTDLRDGLRRSYTWFVQHYPRVRL